MPFLGEAQAQRESCIAGCEPWEANPGKAQGLLLLFKKLLPLQLFILPALSRGSGGGCAAWISPPGRSASLPAGGSVAALPAGRFCPWPKHRKYPRQRPRQCPRPVPAVSRPRHRERPGGGAWCGGRGLSRAHQSERGSAGGAQARDQGAKQPFFLPRPRNGAPAFRCPNSQSRPRNGCPSRPRRKETNGRRSCCSGSANQRLNPLKKRKSGAR